MRRSTILLLCVWSLSATVALAQEEPTSQEQPASNASAAESDTTSTHETIVYRIRSASAKDLQAALAEFLGDSEARITSPPDSDVLLMRVAAANRAEVLELLDELDRSPRRIQFQLLLLRATETELTDEQTAQLSGPTEQVLERIEEMESASGLEVARRFDLEAVENQKTFLSIAERVPVVANTTILANGTRLNSYNMRDVGMILQLLPSVTDDGGISIQLSYEHSELRQPPSEDANSLQPTPPSTESLLHVSTVQIPDGQSALIDGVTERSGVKSSETYLLMGAKVLDDDENSTVSYRAFKQAPPFRSGPLPNLKRSSRVVPKELAKSMFSKMDRNEDGVLTSDEWSKTRIDPTRVDANGDEQITEAELTDWFSTRRRSSRSSRSSED